MAIGNAPCAMMIVGVLGVAVGSSAVVQAEPAGAVVVPLFGVGGRPTFCGANHSGGRAQPQDEGGYRIVGLAPGRHVIHRELTDERIDVLVPVAAGADVVVPPVVVRGPCRALSLRSPVIDVEPAAAQPGWTLRIGRRYQASPGLAPATFARERGLMRLGAAHSLKGVERGPSTRSL